jgi:hypothetical protein
MAETRVGVITHYFGKIGVAVVKATDGPIAVGDTIHIKGHTTDHVQPVEALQVDHLSVERIERGGEAGMKVGVHTHEHDVVYKVTD